MKANILVVDDEREFAEILSERLALKGYTVDYCFGGAEALQKIKDGNFDVIILDLMMPEMDGINTLKQIKALKPIVEVIMLSGKATRGMAIDGMQRGAFEYLTKPCDDQMMIQKIDEAHRRKWEHEERIRRALEDVRRASERERRKE